MVYLKLENAGLKEVWSNISIYPTALVLLPPGDQVIYAYNEDPKVSAPQISSIATHQSDALNPCVSHLSYHFPPETKVKQTVLTQLEYTSSIH